MAEIKKNKIVVDKDDFEEGQGGGKKSCLGKRFFRQNGFMLSSAVGGGVVC